MSCAISRIRGSRSCGSALSSTEFRRCAGRREHQACVCGHRHPRSAEERNRDRKPVRIRYFDLSSNPIKRWVGITCGTAWQAGLCRVAPMSRRSRLCLGTATFEPPGIYSRAVDSNWRLRGSSWIPCCSVNQCNSGTKSGMGKGREAAGPSYVIEANGRHEETRTPDLYRVKGRILFTYNNLKVAGDRQ